MIKKLLIIKVIYPYDTPYRCVLSSFLNMFMSPMFVIADGKLFQILGPMHANALLLTWLFLVNVSGM